MFFGVSLFVNCYLPRFSAYPNSETPGLLKAQNKNTKNFNFFLTKASLFAIISLAVADVAHPVERHLAKVEVASSSLVIRSINSLCQRQRLFLFLSKYSTTSKIKKEKAPEKSKCSICDCATKSHNAFYHLKQALHCSLHTSIRPSYLSGQNSTIASSVYLFINFYTTIGGSLFGKSFFKHTDNRIRKFNFSNDSFKQFVRIAICKK